MIGMIEYLITGCAMIFTLKTLGLKYCYKNMLLALIWWPVIVALSLCAYLNEFSKKDKD